MNLPILKKYVSKLSKVTSPGIVVKISMMKKDLRLRDIEIPQISDSNHFWLADVF
jgi:hypothetical protein